MIRMATPPEIHNVKSELLHAIRDFIDESSEGGEYCIHGKQLHSYICSYMSVLFMFVF